MVLTSTFTGGGGTPAFTPAVAPAVTPAFTPGAGTVVRTSWGFWVILLIASTGNPVFTSGLAAGLVSGLTGLTVTGRPASRESTCLIGTGLAGTGLGWLAGFALLEGFIGLVAKTGLLESTGLLEFAGLLAMVSLTWILVMASM